MSDPDLEDKDDQQDESIDEESADELKQTAADAKDTLGQWIGASKPYLRDGDAALRRGGSAVWQWLTSTQGQLVLAGVAALVVTAGLVATAWIVNGTLAGIMAAVGVVVGVAAPWIYVRVMFAPLLSDVIALGWLIMTQLTHGASALVERSAGGYEWRRLQTDGDQLYAILSDGDRVDIDGELADLPTVAWGKLATATQKTNSNMDELTVSPQFDDERPDPRDDDNVVKTPLTLDGDDDGDDDDYAAVTDGGGWEIDGSKLERWVRGSGSNDLPRNGRRMALEEAGGEQAVSQWFIMIAAGGLVVLGFVLGAGVLLLTG